MKNFLTLILVVVSAQAAFATDECKSLPAASLTCVIPTGTISIEAQPQLSCDGRRDASVVLTNEAGVKIESIIAYELEVISNGERAPLSVRYKTERGNRAKVITLDCLGN